MKKLLLLLLFAGLLNTGSVFGWGREGHETIAKIAERNLTKRAKKAHREVPRRATPIVYFAKWMDEYRHTPEYAFTNDWHTAPVGAGPALRAIRTARAGQGQRHLRAGAGHPAT